MRIVDIREVTIPLEGKIANAVVDFAGHTVSLVAVVSDQRRAGRPVIGFAFNSIGRFAQGGILRDRLIPRLLQAAPVSLLNTDGDRIDPAVVRSTAMRNEKPGGHGDRAGAVAALELAVWDLNAKLADEPAFVSIAAAFGTRPAETVATYAAGGYYYDDGAGGHESIRRLVDELQRYRAQGFDSFKIKVGGAATGVDLGRIEAALEISGDGGRLAVDANGRFDRSAAQAFADAIAPFGLRWFEEPCDPLAFDDHAAVIAGYRGATATGENLFSLADTRNLIAHGGMRPGVDLFQIDPALSYGLTEYVDIVSALEAAGFDRLQCVPHGGHLINLHIAAGLGLGGCESYPGVFAPAAGFPDDCLVGDGRVRPPDAPGFGLERNDRLRPFLDELGRCD